MSVSRYFGLPGCGKTTTLTMLAMKGQASGRYRFVCGNVQLSLHGYVYVPFECLGVYDLSDTLYLIDEAMVEAGDRDYKNFDKCKLEAFVMHRHYNMDIVLFSQEADGIDKKIRSITDRMYYVKKGFLTGKWISSIYRIPYKILWPDSKTAGENVGRIVMGYAKPNIFCRLFARRLYRPKYYRFFDSWERKILDPLPRQFTPFQDPSYRKPIFRPWLNKTVILLRSGRLRYVQPSRKYRSDEAISSPSIIDYYGFGFQIQGSLGQTLYHHLCNSSHCIRYSFPLLCPN